MGRRKGNVCFLQQQLFLDVIPFLWRPDLLLCMTTSQTCWWGTVSHTCCPCRQQVCRGYDLGHEACWMWSGCKSGWNATEIFISAATETISECSKSGSYRKKCISFEDPGQFSCIHQSCQMSLWQGSFVSFLLKLQNSQIGVCRARHIIFFHSSFVKDNYRGLYWEFSTACFRRDLFPVNWVCISEIGCRQEIVRSL